jgi:cephalosporin-C deacetylase
VNSVSFSERPEDFEAFWREAASEAEAVKLDFHRSLHNDWNREGFVVEVMSFNTVGGRQLQGWFAYPEGARRVPGFLWIPPYGFESLLPDDYGTRSGLASLSLNFFGNTAFHREKYQPGLGYFAEGVESPETWVFRRMIQDVLVAARVLQAQIEVDEDRIGAMGMSQGGGIAIAAGAWSPIVRAVCADMPFLGDISRSISNPVYRYPLKELVDFMQKIPLGEQIVHHTIQYFDTCHQASFCFKPTQVSLGLRDPASKPDNVRAIFNSLPGEKLLRELDWGHDWHTSMIEANQTWLMDHLS